jgi:outer membrane protein OmpA-like peptidoglycan-associated protein
LENNNYLKKAGEFLEQNPFKLAVVAAYSGPAGEKDKNEVLTQAQSMVVRKYLIENHRIDDTLVKKIGMGEGSGNEKESRIEILIY